MNTFNLKVLVSDPFGEHLKKLPHQIKKVAIYLNILDWARIFASDGEAGAVPEAKRKGSPALELHD